MSKFIAAGLISSALMFAPTIQAGEKFGFDNTHTSIMFSINHFGFSDVSGKFLKYTGGLDFDRKDPTKSKVNIDIDVASIDTDVAPLDEHLRAKDFFDVANHPSMKFESTKIKKTGKDQYAMTGNLSLHGVTKPVTLNVTLNKAADNPFTKKPALGFKASGVIKRSEFGVSAYVPNVSDEVKIKIDTELHAQ